MILLSRDTVYNGNEWKDEVKNECMRSLRLKERISSATNQSLIGEEEKNEGRGCSMQYAGE